LALEIDSPYHQSSPPGHAEKGSKQDQAWGKIFDWRNRHGWRRVEYLDSATGNSYASPDVELILRSDTRLHFDNGMDTSHDVTQLLLAWSDGDREALEELTPLVYRELKKLAESYLRRERPGHTLQPTALAHEAYIKLIDQQSVRWQNRAHFFGIAAQAMRRILVDHARARLAGKRGSGGAAVSLDEAVDVSDQRADQLVALDDALKRLAQLDPKRGRVVELKYFGGMTLEETAEVLGVSRAKVVREWRMAKAWLYGELNKGS